MWNLFLIRLRRTPKSTRNVTLSHVTTLFQPPSRSTTIARCSRPPGGQTAPTRPPPRPLPASNMVEPQDLWAREHGLRALATTDPGVSGALALGLEDAAVAARGAAVDRPLGAGDVAGLVGGQERHHVRDLCGLAHPAEGQLLRPRRVPGSHAEVGHGRVDSAGVHGADPDAERAEVDGRRLREPAQAPLPAPVPPAGREPEIGRAHV